MSSVAKRGSNVKVHYTGTLEDGTVFDSSEGKDALAFAVGAGQVIDGFDEAVVGMAVGEKKEVHIPIEKAYGLRNDELMMTVPIEQVPEDLKPEIGDRLEVGGPDGSALRVVVMDITDEDIILDGNPPLAGQALNFAIELVELDF